MVTVLVLEPHALSQLTTAPTDSAVLVNAWAPLLQNVMTMAITAGVTALAGVITAVGVMLAKKLGVDLTAQDQVNLENKLHVALNVGIAKSLPLITARGWSAGPVHEAILSTASDYLRQRFPDCAQKITLQAQSENEDDEPVSSTTAITQTLLARLPAAIKIAADSPATPPSALPFEVKPKEPIL